MKKDELNQDIGRHLASLRKAKKIKAQDVAAALGISVTAYHYVETGVTELTSSRIWQLADILGVERYEILGYDANDLCASKTQELKDEIKANQEKIIGLHEVNNTLNQKLLLQERKRKIK